MRCHLHLRQGPAFSCLPRESRPRLGGGPRQPPRQDETAEKRGQTGWESGSNLAPNWLSDLELISVNSLEKPGSD